ncbi:MAG: IPT/TIG domain-containing protein [Actinomycetota bacterium]|nr:IPT/TIG domain-containing protein [Actinomycetota bacterium]
MPGRARKDGTSTRRGRAWATPLMACLIVVSVSGLHGAAAAGRSHTSGHVGWHRGTPVVGAPGVTRSVASIMRQQRIADRSGPPQIIPKPEPGVPERASLPQNPSSPDVSQLPGGAGNPSPEAPFTPQTLGTSFTGATISDTPGFVPPDTMGAVGPTQFIVTVNGRFRSFSKSTGVADGALNVDPDVFFASVIVAGTSDPRIRYDRLSGRWFITMIDINSTDNRILIAVSNTSTITSASNFTFYDIPSDSTAPTRTLTDFADYDTLGIDANALYIGINVFPAVGSLKATDGYVVRKSSVLSGGPIVVTVFRDLTTGSGGSATEGPFTPQGVDNYDPAATEGYFIGVSNKAFGRLDLRRVSNPGGTPSISSNVLITVPTTAFPLAAPQTGSSKTLDTLDDRLFAAHIRNGKLWTAHNIGVNSSGTSSGTISRTASRWYELTGIPSPQTPSIVESGTIFDGAATNPRFFTIPSVMVSGQGHAALGFTTAGKAEHPNAATVGRLVGDPLGTVETTQLYTNSTTVYGPQSGTLQRWGDYSYTSLDPLDDMTMWTIQEFNNTTNSWAVRVVKLIAPPPATPASASPSTIAAGQSSVNVTITGTQVSGSGFYDPGSNLTGNALPFSHIGGSVTGGVTVNSVTFTSPTSVTLNVSTVGATSGAQNVTVTNPDGQTKTGTGILTISGGGGGPTITSINPNTLGQGGTRNVTVNGTNFQAGATTSVSGTGVTVVSTTFVSSTKLTVKLKAAASATVGARDVTVSSGGTATCPGCLTIDPAPAPTSTSPNTGARGATMNVTVFGSNFVSGAKATFGAGITVNSTSFVSSGQLTANITIAAGATTGPRTVKVVNPDKGVGNCAGCFTVT